MATTAAILNIAVRADTGRATSSLRQFDATLNRNAKTASAATRNLDKLDSSNRRLSTSLRSVAKYAVAAGAGYAGIAAARDAIGATEDLAKATISLNRNLGLTVETASEFSALAFVRGADTRTLTMATKTLSSQMEAAKKGTASAVDSFKALGVSQQEIKKTSPDKLLFKIADGAKAAGDGSARTSALGKLLGRSFSTLGPILRDGSDALKEQLDTANKYGATFAGKPIKSVEDLIKTQRELKLAQLGLQVQFTTKIAPALITVGMAFAGAVNAVRKLIAPIKLLPGRC